MNFLRRHMKVTRDAPVDMLLFQLGFLLFGVVMVVIINATVNEDRDYAPIGSMMSLMGIFVGVFLRGSGTATRFRLAVSMGQTRRDYLLMDPLLTAVTALLGIGLAWCIQWFELWLYGTLYPGYSCEFDLSVVFRWQVVLALTAAAVAADLCLGALQLRFGTKGFAVVWFPLCFLPGILSSAVNAAREGSTSLLAQIGRGVLFLVHVLRPAMWAALGAAVVLALVILSVRCYRKAEIRL